MIIFFSSTMYNYMSFIGVTIRQCMYLCTVDQNIRIVNDKTGSFLDVVHPTKNYTVAY